MICLGYDAEQKRETVRDYCADHGVRTVFTLAPVRFRVDLAPGEDHVEWPEIIQYKHFYRLLQAIGKDTLVIVNECLRTQNRNDLTYNCMRHFLQQAGHQIIFQYLPIINTADDCMVLFDFDTRSRWKREKWRPEFRTESDIRIRRVDLSLRAVDVPTDNKTMASYAREKRKLIDGLGLRDPHTIPRNLLLMAGKAKLPHVDSGRRYVGRNNRFGLSNMETYREATGEGERVVFELPHNFLDLADFLTVSRQRDVSVLRSDLKVDRWYFDRYQAWAGRVADAYAALQ